MADSDKKAPERKPPSHLQSHAHELIAKHGPRTLAMISMSFQNLGNIIPGQTVDDQLAALEKELRADPRMAVVGDNPGRGGDWWGFKPDDKKV